MRPIVTPMAAFIALLSLVLAAHTVSAQPGESGRKRIREGNDLYEKQQFPDAEVSYRKALEAADEPVAAKFNLGDALYQQERYDEAAGQYEGAASAADDGSVRAQAYHNLGNALLKGNKLDESIASYKEALKLNPKDEDTRYNLEYAKRLLQQQQQQQQQKQDKKDEKKDEKKEEKKDQQDKKDDQQQKQDQQDKENQKKDQKQQPRQPKDQISKADAERILEALKQKEQDVKKKLQKQPVRVKVEKDW